ncbi:hypothetical protein [Paenarthrobacter sp. NEAU-H11]|uniref:hypothetical protein n=1 Tax=Paenarthrobacter sp. NEAU-H11 TaxID=3423924 RepID=UPI003D344CB7
MAGETGLLSNEEDPAAAIKSIITAIVTDLRVALHRFDPIRVIEVARLACLPWAAEGTNSPMTPEAIVSGEGGFNRAELLALIVASDGDETLSDEGSQGAEESAGRATRSLSQVIGDALPKADRILKLASLLDIIGAEPEKPLAMLALMMRGSEMWIRNSSYPDMVADTVRQLFGKQEISQQLERDLGFDAAAAMDVLDACHELQVDRLNSRLWRLIDDFSAVSDDPAPADPEEMIQVWQSTWEPTAELITVTIDEICTATGLPASVVAAVLDHFTFEAVAWTPEQLVYEFTRGNNLLRTRPVLRSADGAAMLIHGAHIVTAVRESLEQHLKTTTVWEPYQRFRGDLLEARTKAAFRRILDSATTWDGFEYYVPANEAEERGKPSGFSKRVEGDHLIVQDDVAFIVEDKAVALTANSRTGDTRSFRRDLTGIITKASIQASRLQERIQRDGGLRIHREGWVDLSRIREIHTIAVSLDDLLFAHTATAELVKAGLLSSESIPWTVSIHDLDLITQLIDRPSEFLLYLRRRRDPEATVFYSAPDELDLFLYFYEAGLYVEPDPDLVKARMPFMPAPTTAERRRYETQAPAIITSRTEPLDRWHAAQVAINKSVRAGTTRPEDSDGISDSGGETEAAPPKPRMSPSPLGQLVDTVESRRDYGWLSVGATLLAGSFEFQEKMAKIPSLLLSEPSSGRCERTAALPFGNSLEEGWLLVWCTRPPGRPPASFERQMRDYLRAKMHQLGLPRGASFAYDETTGQLIDVFFDDHVGELEPRLQARLDQLRAPGDFDRFEPAQRAAKKRTKR